ncbi:MAG TPA: hypothetical protein VN796_01415 [Acidimicrobiales bacterium]|nr:hypothetical protein [Acidimicrobiales bacterium]
MGSSARRAWPLVLVLVVVPTCGPSHGAVSGSVDGHATTTCAVNPPAVAAAKVPASVARWARGAPVIGSGSLWTIRSALDVRPDFRNGRWLLKFPWYLRPPGVPEITGRRIDGRGAFHADDSQAVDAHGVWDASSLQFSVGGCWEITGRFHASTLTVRIRVPPS